MAMSIARQIMDVHPTGFGLIDRKKLDAALGACREASQGASMCADACLNEGMVKDMRECLRACLDCADVVDAAVRVLSRHTGWNESAVLDVLRGAMAVLRACDHEASRHASMHMPCRLAAESCRKAHKALDELLASLA